MAYLNDGICISTDNSIKYYRLPVSETTDTFIINSARNSVSSIQKIDQKLIQMWNLPQPECFTSPAVYWPDHDFICCVVEHKKILVWNSSSDNLKSAQKIKLENSIFTILHVSDKAPLVVFCNGSVISMSDIHNTDSSTAPGCLNDRDEKLIWTDAAVINEKIVIIQLTHVKMKKLHNLRSYNTIEGKYEEMSATCVPLCQTSLTLKSYCLNCSPKHVKFITLWENGDVYAYILGDSKPELLFQVPHINKVTHVGIDVIGTSHLAVAKCNDNKGTLEIWDLKYHIVKETKDLTHNLSSKNLQVKTLKSYLFIPFSDGLLMFQVTLEPSSLSSAVGKSTSSGKTSVKNTFTWSNNFEDVNMIVDGNIDENEALQFETEKSFDDILTEAANRNLTDCSRFLEKSTNISEEQLIKLLKIVISQKENSSCSILLNLIFTVPFSDIFLRQNLRDLSFNEALVVLNELLDIFTSHLHLLKNKKPDDLQVVTWIQLLMQVHFEELLLSPDKSVRLLLKKLHKSLHQMMDVYSELKEIQHLIILVQKEKNIIPDKSTPTKYCIETLHL